MRRPPRRGTHLIEVCAGSAALSWHLLGCAAPLPYQGGKHRVRKALASAMGLVPGGVDRFTWTDPGPWGTTLGALADPELRRRTLEHLASLVDLDPRDVFRQLQGAKAPADAARFAAEHLFLQRLAFSGKAVGVYLGNWSSPGFNTSSAYGIEATDKFGAVRPQVPALLEKLRSAPPRHKAVALSKPIAAAFEPPARRPQRMIVYIDPPYQDSTGYPNGILPRAQVIELAQAWADWGAEVHVSEAAPLAELQDLGWTITLLNPGKAGSSPFHGKHPEYLTSSPKLSTP